MERYREREKRADRRAGEAAIAAYNVARDTKKEPDGWTWVDIFPEWREPVPPMSQEQMLEAMTIWARIKATPA